MSKLDKFKRKDKNSDNVWSSISDLMSGLMIVFLFTSVIFMSKVIDENTNIKKQQQTVENIVTTYEESKENDFVATDPTHFGKIYTMNLKVIWITGIWK